MSNKAYLSRKRIKILAKFDMRQSGCQIPMYYSPECLFLFV